MFAPLSAMAFQNAARNAGSVLVEPVMRVRVSIHHEDADDVAGDLVSRRGERPLHGPRGAGRTIDARVPLTELSCFRRPGQSRFPRGRAAQAAATSQILRECTTGARRGGTVRLIRTRQRTSQSASAAAEEPRL